MRAIKTTTISILALGLLAGSAVGVAAQGTAFSGFADISCIEIEGYGEGQVPERCGGAIEVSDTRISGDLEFTSSLIESELGDGEGFSLFGPMEMTITNDRGTWSGPGIQSTIVLGDDEDFGWRWILTGDGEYAGLSALLDDSGEEARGVIIEGTFPELPAE